MYDAPMSMEDLLADEARRRAAYGLLGIEPAADPASVPPAAPQPTVLAPPTPVVPATPPSDFASLARRYLEAQQMDARDDRFTRLGNAFDTAARTINAGAGFDHPGLQSTGPKVSRAQAVEDAARIEALGLKGRSSAGGGQGGRRQLSTDATSPESRAAQKALLAQFKDLTQDDVNDVPEAFAERFAITHNATLERTSRESWQGKKSEQDRIDSDRRADAIAKQLGLSRDRLAQEEWLALVKLGDTQAAREAREKADAKEKLDEVSVPGFDIAPGATPTKVDAQKMKDTNESALRMQGGIDRLRSLHRQYGENPKGNGAELQQQALRGVQLEAKNIVGLGALSGPDMGLMTDLSTQDVNSIMQWVRRNFVGATLEQSLNGLEDWMRTSIAASAKARGYVLQGAAPARTTPTEALPRDADGNPTLDSTPTRAPSPPPPPAAPPVKKTGKGAAGPSRPDRKLDPTKKEESRTFSSDGKWMKVYYTDGTYGLAPANKTK